MEEVVHAVFSYGTLRGDYGPDGDRWGVLQDTEGTWRRARVSGFRLHQRSGLPYPFVVRTADPSDIVIGTLLEWSSQEAGRRALARCDAIEKCDPARPGSSLYQRCLAEVSAVGGACATQAWIYYQDPPADGSDVRNFEDGDWLAAAQMERKAEPRAEAQAGSNTGGPVFAAWLHERLGSGDSASCLAQRIGAGGYVDGSASDEELTAMLEAFASQIGGKACESIRQVAFHAKREPGIPFSLWLQERSEMGATAKQVLSVLSLPASSDATKSDEELWQGLWQLAQTENAWAIVREMSSARLVEAPPRAGCCTCVGALDEVAPLIQRSSRILVLTGAGISASCGIPTFRDNGGFYDQVAKEFGLSSPEEVNDIRTFRRNPLPWFKHVRAIVPSSSAPRRPSLTHRFIAALEERGKLLWQYTQNIDCLESAAGVTRVTFCHGSFASATCIKCGHHLADGAPVNDAIAEGRIPYCEKCGDGVLKPDVVLFNEPMPKGVHEGLEKHTDEADLLLVLGTSLNVAPCSLIPSLVGASGDAARVLINAELAGRASDFEHFLEGPADDTVGRLLEALGWQIGAQDTGDPAGRRC